MKVQQELVFIGLSKYDFTDKDSGRKVSGVKIHLIDPSSNSEDENYHGLEVVTMNGHYSMFEKLYKCSPLKSYLFSIDINNKGKFTVLDVTNK